MSQSPSKQPSRQEEELPMKAVYFIISVGAIFALIFMSFLYFSTH